MLSGWTRPTKIALLLALSLLWLSSAMSVGAASTLSDAAVLLSDLRPGRANVSAVVRFTLPDGSDPITPNNFIRIHMRNYSGVRQPFTGSGWTGEPTFGVTGNTAFVTNISVEPGSVVTIAGIFATNPASASDFSVTIDLAPFLTGPTIFDSVTVQPNTLQSGVVVSVTVLGTSVKFKGLTSPGALVAIVADGVVVGIAFADENGVFAHAFDINDLIAGLDPRDATFTISIQDVTGLVGTPIELSFPLVVGQLNEFDWAILPPTLKVIPSEIPANGTITVAGRAAPNSTLLVFVDGVPAGGFVTANGEGVWATQLSGPWTPGTHEVHAINQEARGRVSAASVDTFLSFRNIAMAVVAGSSSRRSHLHCRPRHPCRSLRRHRYRPRPRPSRLSRPRFNRGPPRRPYPPRPACRCRQSRHRRRCPPQCRLRRRPSHRSRR